MLDIVNQLRAADQKACFICGG
jgi:hypothetical protein